MEIITVNDGSTDRTKEILQMIEGIKLIHHPCNRGYGAALKTGVENAKYDWVLFYDSDGQHQPVYIEKLKEYQNECDMIIGAKVGYRGPLFRQPSKKILHLLAEYLIQKKIPDLNSGFRLMKKSIFEKFADENRLANSYFLKGLILTYSLLERCPIWHSLKDEFY